MPPKTGKATDTPLYDEVAAGAAADGKPDTGPLFRRQFVLPGYAAGTDCSPAVVTEAIQQGHRPTTAPFVESTEDLPGDRKRVVWAVAI